MILKNENIITTLSLQMYYKNKILCIIPARKNSVGLKNKNLLKINGKPMIYWPINAALKSKLVDYTIVTTDCPKIRNISNKLGAQTPFLRPKRLATSTSKIYDVIIHTINYLTKKNEMYDYLVLLEPTSPLTKYSDVDGAIKKLINDNKATSLVSMTQNIISHPVFNLSLNNNNYIKKYLRKKISINRQKISKLYYLSGNIYISKISSYIKLKSFVQDYTYGFIVNKWKANEIDDMVDYIKTKAIMKFLNKKK